MAEQRNPVAGRPIQRAEEEKSRGVAPPGGAGDADTAGKPSDDRPATGMAAALIESKGGESDDEAPSDVEAPRDPA